MNGAGVNTPETVMCRNRNSDIRGRLVLSKNQTDQARPQVSKIGQGPSASRCPEEGFADAFGNAVRFDVRVCPDVRFHAKPPFVPQYAGAYLFFADIVFSIRWTRIKNLVIIFSLIAIVMREM